jgi:hypothetical protein
MTSGLQVEKIAKTQDVKPEMIAGLKCPNPGVDSERSQGGPVGDFADSQFGTNS